MSYDVRFELCCSNPDCQNFKKRLSFIHASCKGELYINRYGMINCKKCGEKYYILDSKQSCKRCGNDIINNFCGFIFNIGRVAISYYGNEEMINFYNDLVENITKKK